MPHLNQHINSFSHYTPGFNGVQGSPAFHQPLSSIGEITRLMTASVLIAAMIVSGSKYISASNTNLTAIPIENVAVVNNEPEVTTTKQEPDPVLTNQSVAVTKDKGLQSILNKWQAEYKWGKFGVVVTELKNSKRSASLNRHQQFFAASLYKLFLADYTYERINNGSLSFNSTLNNGSTVDNCLRQMMVYSSNICGHAIGDKIGWTKLINNMHADGFNDAKMTDVISFSANDIAAYLEQLYKGKSIVKSHRKQLLGYMKEQIYRNMIPAGVPNRVVADKTGNLGYFWHDAAIVYSPKGDYVMVVMSQNSGPWPITVLSTRVSDYFNKN